MDALTCYSNRLKGHGVDRYERDGFDRRQDPPTHRAANPYAAYAKLPEDYADDGDADACADSARISTSDYRPSAYSAPRLQHKPVLIFAAVIVIAIAIIAVGVALSKGAQEPEQPQGLVTSAMPSTTQTNPNTPTPAGTPTATAEKRVTFCAVGDNLANDRTLEIADMWGGTGAGDGVYDFSPLYREISPVVSGYDIAFVNQETVLGGNTDWDWSGYPSYNTPDSMAQALVDAGFDVVSSNTNHTYDYWTTPIEHAQQLWAGFSSVAFIGSYSDEADRAQVRVVERNGVKVAFLSYSYGQNGYEQSDLPNDYYAVPWDAQAFTQDYARARQAADIVVVYMHGGDEYTSTPNDWQREVAQTCADAGVDLLIGSHAHVIQSFEEVTRADGSGTMPCAFGLGDFVSSYTDYPETVLSGMFSCDFVLDDTGAVQVENLAWTPLVEYWTYSQDGTPDDYVRLVSGMSAEEAAGDYLLSSLGSDALDWMRQHTEEVLGGSGIEIRD